MNHLDYGDNLLVLREAIADESVEFMVRPIHVRLVLVSYSK